MTMTQQALPEEQPHILVVDDDDRLREALRRYLSQNGFIVSAAADAAAARRMLASLHFDLMVLDVRMPGESGLQLTRSLRADGGLPILLLTANGQPDDRIAGLEAGADDYLPKPFEPRELVLRITSILRRLPKPASAAAEVRLGRWVFDAEREELRSGDETVRLTSGEASLLRTLAAQPGVVFTREDLGRAGIDSNARAIDVQVTRLRRKIETDPRQPRYLQTVRGEGYVLRPD
ncbi:MULTISPECIES: response regulator [Nitrospirillum]|uniref:Winged helix family two component transcriptional regulator n=1 Tax=Nitrospirillum amazonense TaxID=28077 RepID=A0A560FRF1_9PROT|nr:response regulator [Nitrospirillum amazonense]MEC4591494.1 response regulator [Nitrospirillum amazonense]TWB24217.1 winged helix family two component transcriptional regulator [Nitrospirillum amazonense]